jgi:hypothetical protein
LTAIASRIGSRETTTGLVEVVTLASSESGPSAAADPVPDITESDLGHGLLAFSQEL